MPLHGGSAEEFPQTTEGQSTDQKQTSAGTRSPEQPSTSETKMQRRQSEMKSWQEGPSPTLSASREANLPRALLRETHGEATSLPPSVHQPTPLTLGRALYLLSMGKLTAVPEILFRAPIIDLFNHFAHELVEDPDWAVTLAGIDYTHYGYSYILKEEARHFACVAWNMTHQEQHVEVPARYRRPLPDISSVTTTPEPMEGLQPHPQTQPQYTVYLYPTPMYLYPHGYGLPNSHGYTRPFAGTGMEQPMLPQPPAQPPDPPQQPQQPPVLPQLLHQPPPRPPPPPPPGPPAGPRQWGPP
ncbi:hypothetical protein ARMGADRAFT_1082355 [Armillaria gallica]|uniref:Uncharacterized protein n=1 Tax=Armillaria gallica TaxID=47427 RepID=A0A2H3D955_ARMGA|nr:hypothetical protein ARMGADRAFT_1082355 [Armillaria gallica]